jgi:hypothetical protein
MKNTIKTAQLRTMALTNMGNAGNLTVKGYLNSYNRANTIHMKYQDSSGDRNIVDIHVTENMCSVRHVMQVKENLKWTSFHTAHYWMTTFEEVLNDLNKLAKI